MTATQSSIEHSAVTAPVSTAAVIQDARGKPSLDIKKLDAPLSKQVTRLETELYKSAAQMGKGALGMGKALGEINAALEPLGLFTFYLNRLAWLSPATAYRYMGAYRSAQAKLPGVVIELALASGVPLEKKRFIDALEGMDVPDGRIGAEGAKQWLQKLKEKARVPRKTREEKGSVEATQQRRSDDVLTGPVPPTLAKRDLAVPFLARQIIACFKQANEGKTFDEFLQEVTSVTVVQYMNERTKGSLSVVAGAHARRRNDAQKAAS